MKKFVSAALVAAALLVCCFFVSCATADAAAETASSSTPSDQDKSAAAEAAPSYVLNASEMALNADITDGTKAGTNGFFTMNVPNPAESKLVVDANSKTVEGVSYSQRLKLGGMLNTVRFTVPAPASVKVVCCSSSSSSPRSLEFMAENAAVTSVAAPGSPVQSIVEIPAGTYTLQAAGGGGVNIYAVEVTLK